MTVTTQTKIVLTLATTALLLTLPFLEVRAQNNALTADPDASDAGYDTPALDAIQCDTNVTQTSQTCLSDVDAQRYGSSDTSGGAPLVVGETLEQVLPPYTGTVLTTLEAAPEGEHFVAAGTTLVRIDSETRVITKLFPNAL